MFDIVTTEVYSDPFDIVIYKYIKELVDLVLNLVDDSTHLKECVNGLEILKQLPEENTDKAVMEALSYFDKVDDTDKQYIQFVSLYYKARCYVLLGRWEDCYKMIECMDRIEIDFRTVHRKTIKLIKENIPVLLLNCRYYEVRELENDLNSVKTELISTRTELEGKESELATTKSELNYERTKLKEIESDLAIANADLEQARKEMKEMESKLAIATSDQVDARKKLEETRSALQDSREELNRVRIRMMEERKSSMPTWAYITICTILVAATAMVCSVVFG